MRDLQEGEAGSKESWRRYTGIGERRWDEIARRGTPPGDDLQGKNTIPFGGYFFHQKEIVCIFTGNKSVS